MANKSLAKSPTELTILVTGGAGFIGSHTCVELLAKGFNVVIVDDLSNSSEVAVERVRKIAGVGADRCAFHKANVLDRDAMEAIKKMKKDSVITEDEQKTAETELQKVTDNHVKELDRIGADTPDCTEGSLKTHISNLRSKLRNATGKDHIEAVWGIGFRLRPES